MDSRDRILLVENDPVISDLIGKQALQAAGYQYFVVPDVNSAIARSLQLAPDVIIVDLNLPGLSGKDLLVALSSQGIETPVIVLAHKGMEPDVIQSFRLGAVDYMTWPLREAEVVTVVERALRVVHERRDRERLARQLQQMNQELQARVRELTTIFAVGKAVTSITDQGALFGKIVEGAAKVTQADLGWFLLREEKGKAYLLAGSLNLPASMNLSPNQAWDDGISSLVAMSGEPLSIHGEPLKRFKIASLGQSALIVPVKVQKEVIGLLVMMRKAAAAFTPSEQHLLDAVADYASISLVNARLFRAVEERARSLQRLAENAELSASMRDDLLQSMRRELRRPLRLAREAFEKISKDPTIKWDAAQRETLSQMQAQLKQARSALEAMEHAPEKKGEGGRVNFGEVIKSVASQYKALAKESDLSLVVELAEEPVWLPLSSEQARRLTAALISNAVKFAPPDSKVRITLEPPRASMAHLIVQDSGEGLGPEQAARLFEPRPAGEGESPADRFGGLEIGLPLVQAIASRYNGKVWCESQEGNGTTFHLSLPIAH